MAILYTGNHSSGLGSVPDLNRSLVTNHFNNFRRVDDTTLTAESEEELKSPLMKVKKESEIGGLKLNI